MLNSLRARLMLVSAGLSGAALAVFAAWTYTRLYDAGLQEVDAQLRNLGEHALLRPERNNDGWDELDRALAMLSRSDDGNAHLMLVLGHGGETIAQSAFWPENLPREKYKAPTPEGPEQRTRPGDFGGRPREPDPYRNGDRPPPPRDGFGPGRGGPERRPGPEGFGRPPDDRGPPEQLERSGNPPPSLNDQPREGVGGGPQPRPGGFGPPNDRGQPGDFRRDGPPPPRPEDGPPGRGGGPFPPRLHTPMFSSHELEGGTWRVVEMGTPQAALVFGIRLDNFRREMGTVRTTFLSASGLALLGIVLGAWAISNQALAPVRRLSRAIEGVSARGLDQRVPEETRDPELRQLTQQFNAMMLRLEGSFTQAVRFSADAAHELKTPLSILQGHLEEALRKEPEGSDRQETYSKLLEEVQRLKTIVGKLLLLARADAGQLTPSKAPVNFSQAVEETCEDTRILAPTLDISAEIEPEVRIEADDALLRQVLQNLCSNAIKYNMKAGKIRFRLRRKDNAAVFTVWNTGKPIPDSDRERIFDRFYRVDTSRARKVGGAGLGLSLAREIARAHGGDLTLETSKEGWIGFRLSLPLSLIG